MEKVVVASVSTGAGKTSVIVGLARSLKRSFGYLKPFGDRLVYREKKVWDFDADLLTALMGVRKDPEDLTIGFEHAKLRYMYDGEGRRKRLQEMVSQAQGEILFVEGGKSLRYGVSLGLDAISVAKDIGAELVIVISGNEDVMMDDAVFVKKYLEQPFTRIENIWDETVKKQMEDDQKFHQTSLYITVNRALSSASPYGKEASRAIVKEYKKEWLTQLSPRDRQTSMRLAFALYDEKLYEDALAVFQKMPMMKMWEGFMLDLLGRRSEAIECYKTAIAMPRRGPRGNTYGQYGITDTVEYIKQYLEKSFVRVENNAN